MFRFIALAWDNQDSAAAATAEELTHRLTISSDKWRCVLETDSHVVFHTTQSTSVHKAYVLHDSAGVIFGNLFMRFDSFPRTGDVVIDRRQSRDIWDTRGRHLTYEYWGRYIGLLMHSKDQSVSVIRDPTGAMPCLVTRIRKVQVVCSTMAERLMLERNDLAINWRHVASYLWYDRIATSETGFDNVRQVRAGECVLLGRENTTSVFYWSPARISRARTIEDYATAVKTIRTVVTQSVDEWASQYKCVLHELSGGLDSTIVLSCLVGKRSAASIVCQNYFTEGTAGDERYYARKAADAAGVNLFETSLKKVDRHLVDAFESTCVATPVLLQMVSDSHLAREHLARRHHAGAIFSGQGGDHLFQQRRTPLIAADFAWQHGMKSPLANIVIDTARLTGRSIWAVMRCVVANGFLRRQHDPYAQIDQPLILSTAGRDVLNPSCIRHPWVDNAADMPCGKRAAILSVIDTQNFYNSSCAYADVVHPLISQPVMELCLQIPSYVLTYSGVDRALVRDAFRKSLPPEIAGRTTKGCTTSYFHGLIVRDLPFLREYLLDGLLSKSGIVDTAFVEASLRESSLVRDPRLISPLLNAIRAEVWLRTWSNGSRQTSE